MATGLSRRTVAARNYEAACRTRTGAKHLRRAPFDSWFEVDVFIRIAERGYRVAPQFHVAGYRIDMVVEGASARLAVECDGDEFHGGLEQYEADMARQRRLERCGVVFWRVGGGEYYRNPAAAMEHLWSVLDRRGIHPERYEDQAGGSRADATATVDVISTQPESSERRAAPESDDAGDALDSTALPASGPDETMPPEPPQTLEDLLEFLEDPANTRSQPQLDGSGEPRLDARLGAADSPGWLTHGVIGPLDADTVPPRGPYRVAGIDVPAGGIPPSKMPRERLAKIVTGVVSVESPILVHEVIIRVAMAYGAAGIDGDTQLAVERAVRYAAGYHWIVRRGDMLWSNDDDAPVIRDRSQGPQELRLTRAVPTVELEWAVHRAVADAGAIARVDAARTAARLLGFRRTSEQFKLCVDEALEKALLAGAIRQYGGTLRLDGVHVPAAPTSGVGASRSGGFESYRQRKVDDHGAPSSPDACAEAEEQARILIRAAANSDKPRTVLTQIEHLGRAAVSPLIQALADPRLATLAVTALVELGPLAKEALVRALESRDIQVRIHAGEALSRAGLDSDL